MQESAMNVLQQLAQEKKLSLLTLNFIRYLQRHAVLPDALIWLVVQLTEAEAQGHSCITVDDEQAAATLLTSVDAEQRSLLKAAFGTMPADLQGWQQLLAQCPLVRIAGSAQADAGQPLILDQNRLYLRRYWQDEQAIANAIQRRLDAPEQNDVPSERIRHWLDQLFPAGEDQDGPDWQRIACALSLRGRFSVITGGPGTGKTYTVARLLCLLLALQEHPDQFRIALAAPTGKAAARLKQSIDGALKALAPVLSSVLNEDQLATAIPPATTLHSLLGARPDTRRLRHHAGNPLQMDVLVVDEASMIHLEMMANLLDALSPHTLLILLGDKDQLASVEAGAVMADLCEFATEGGYRKATAEWLLAATGQQIPDLYMTDRNLLAQHTAMLRKSRRFGGAIGQLAIAVNEGNAEQAEKVLRQSADEVLSWQQPAQTVQCLDLFLNGRGAHPHASGFAAFRQIVNAGAQAFADYESWVQAVLQVFDRFRVLCAVREGDWGVQGLNALIENTLLKQEKIKRQGDWYIGRPVIVTRNDYSLRVFNGDIGICLPDPLREGSVRVYFHAGDGLHSVLASRLSDVETAYAMTVHKSQGSEFGHVALILPPQQSQVMTRELLYTGITRAKTCFTLLTPSPSALQQATAQVTRRNSGLRYLL
jgi:exodeoxyribonuclease V alpha subunit